MTTAEERARLDAYSQRCRERDALATYIALQWGWPSGRDVIDALAGDRTTALGRFGDAPMIVYLDGPTAFETFVRPAT